MTALRKRAAPIYRSPLRLSLGTKYYRVKRCLQWLFGGVDYAKKHETRQLEYLAYSHKSPLLRKLKDVDMWLQENKVVNLKIAAQQLDWLIVEPGQALSFWRCVGKTNRAKGYVEGMVLVNGKVTSGTGGGLCQLSNLIYWMTLHTPLEVTERHRHGYDVFPDSDRTQPFGSGATCSYNYIDLQIYNCTPERWQLRVFIEDGFLKGEWRTSGRPERRYEVYEKNHIFTPEYWSGYMRHNEIYRRVFDLQGNLIDDEYVTENHAIMMYSPFLESESRAGTGKYVERPDFDRDGAGLC